MIGADVETAAERVDAHDAVGEHLRQQRLHRVGSQATDTGAIDDPVEAVDLDAPRAADLEPRGKATVHRRNAVEPRGANREPARGTERVDPLRLRRARAGSGA